MHYCQVHQSKFYRNEKLDQNGDQKIWYSHKIKNGVGFCTEQPKENAEKSLEKTEQIPLLKDDVVTRNSSYAMYACNAMNNAVSLAANGKIEVSEIGKAFRKLLSELQSI